MMQWCWSWLTIMILKIIDHFNQVLNDNYYRNNQVDDEEINLSSRLCVCVSIKNHYLWWPSSLVSSQANKERSGGESMTGWISKWNVLSKLFLDKLFHFTTNLTVQTELPWNWCCTETLSLSLIAIFFLTTCSLFLIHFLPPLLPFLICSAFF